MQIVQLLASSWPINIRFTANSRHRGKWTSIPCSINVPTFCVKLEQLLNWLSFFCRWYIPFFNYCELPSSSIQHFVLLLYFVHCQIGGSFHITYLSASKTIDSNLRICQLKRAPPTSYARTNCVYIRTMHILHSYERD